MLFRYNYENIDILYFEIRLSLELHVRFDDLKLHIKTSILNYTQYLFLKSISSSAISIER